MAVAAGYARAGAWAGVGAAVGLAGWVGTGSPEFALAMPLLPVAAAVRDALDSRGSVVNVPEPSTPAEAAARRINDAPARFAYLLQMGLASRHDLLEGGTVYVLEEDVEVWASPANIDGATSPTAIEVSIDVFSYVPRGEYNQLKDAIVSSPFIRGYVGEVLRSAPHEFRAMIALEPLPEGRVGPHVLAEVPVLQGGHLAMGQKAAGQEVAINRADKPMGAVFGPTRKGKSLAIELAVTEDLLALREDGSFDYDTVIAATSKNRADFASVAGFAEVYGSNDQASFTNRIVGLMKRGIDQAKEWEDRGYTKLTDIPLEKRPGRVSLYFDECADWLLPPAGKGREDSAEYILGKALSWWWRKAGFLGWNGAISDQGGKYESFGVEGNRIILNSGWRLAYGPLTPTIRGLLMYGTEGEDEFAEGDPPPGRANLWINGSIGLTEFQGYLIQTDDREQRTAAIRQQLMRAGRPILEAA